MCYDFLLAGIRIRCYVPFFVTVTEESAPFLQPAEVEEADVNFFFCPVEGLSCPEHEGIWLENTLFTPHGTYHRGSPGEAPYARVCRNGSDLRCDYVAGMERMMERARNLVDLMGLETLLLAQEGMLLHAAYIRWQRKGILFTGPSGIGKSTQADLWQRFCGSETINGDRAALRKEDGRWQAWGLPYAGTSGIYRNESAPVTAIVLLEQGKEDRLERLSPAEAFRGLYPQTTIHRWEADFVRCTGDLLLQMAGQIPVYRLTCLPHKEAVELLKQELMKGE